MKVCDFLNILNTDFFVGVPDSQLRPLCDYLYNEYGNNPKKHIIAANEGNAVGIAAGYHLATGKVPLVYMQNSGEGNVINPIASLVNDKVYAIPVIFVIGWRGEPGVHDEPQHIFQGEVTLKLMQDMDVEAFVVDSNTTCNELSHVMELFEKRLKNGKQVAFVIKKGALEFDKKVSYSNEHKMSREEALSHIITKTGEDIVVSSTGKISREIFEIRDSLDGEHKRDFLTVGSMGHCSSIALGIALNKQNKKIWCIDGDGAVLMHMGAMAVIGSKKPSNLAHVVINNEAHETVGGMPTVAADADLCNIARACGYDYVAAVSEYTNLDEELKKIREMNVLSFLEIKCRIGSRKDLGRPSIAPVDNKENFMTFLQGE